MAARFCASHQSSYSSLRVVGVDLPLGLEAAREPRELELPIELIVPRAGKSIGFEPPNSDESEPESRRLRAAGTADLGTSPVMGLRVRDARGLPVSAACERPIGGALASSAAS